MKQLFLALFTILAITIFSGKPRAQTDILQPNTIAPIVVELFTSQRCPSCPPADKILSKLAQHENIITLGCHVSYWNNEQIKDRISQEFCDIRQHGYAGMSGTKKIYTPQMIVNGENPFNGADANLVNLALKNIKNEPTDQIKIEITEKNIINFTLSKIKHGNYRLWAFGYKYQTNEKSRIHTTPALSYTNLGGWHGDAKTNSFQKPDVNIDGIAIFAQDGGYGKIVAAGKLNFFTIKTFQQNYP